MEALKGALSITVISAPHDTSVEAFHIKVPSLDLKLPEVNQPLSVNYICVVAATSVNRTNVN